VTRRPRHDERGDAVLIGCVGLAAFFLLVGFAVIDYWSALSVDRNLQAIAQDAASAGASGIDVTAYRDSGIVQLDPADATSLAMEDLRSQPSSELPASVLGATARSGLFHDRCNWAVDHRRPARGRGFNRPRGRRAPWPAHYRLGDEHRNPIGLLVDEQESSGGGTSIVYNSDCPAISTCGLARLQQARVTSYWRNRGDRYGLVASGHRRADGRRFC
jgi:hypothetical protein